MIAEQVQEARTLAGAALMRRNKKGHEWPKWKALLKQIGMCTATRRCGEPSGYDVLCPKHRALKQQRDARHRANKVKARGWKWARVPVETAR